MGISTPLDTPFHSGGALGSQSILSPDVPYLAQVAINGHPYMIDAKQYQRTTIAAQRQPTDTSMEPGEQTLNTEGLWRRSQQNWVLGCNQYYLDNIASLYSLYERAGENQSLRYRFWTSKNVDIWTSGQLKLLPLVETKYTGVTSALQVVTVGSFLYIVEGQVVKYTSNPGAVSPTWTTYTFQTGTPGNITSVTSDGAYLWAACGANGVWQIPAGVTTGAAKVGTITPDFIVYGNGRLVCGTGPTLTELNRDGTTTAIGAHKNASWFWTNGCSSADAVYVAGSVGHVGEVHQLALASGSITLAPPTLAAPLPPGELPLSMVYTGGHVVVGTTAGFRLANIAASNNGLVFGPVVPVAGGVNGLSAWGEYVYFTWSKFTAPGPIAPSSTIQSSGVGRADLGRFTSPLVPAFASDLQIDDTATSSTNWTISSVAIFGGLPYFAGADAGGTHTYCCGADPTKVAAAGMFQSGWTRYNTIEAKVVASIDYHHDALPTGASIGAYLILENSTVVTLPTSNQVSTLGPSSPFATNYLVGEAFNTQIYLLPDATQTTSPVLRRYTIRSLITPRRMEEILLPIIMKTKVESIAGEGSDVFQDVLGEYQFLSDLCNRGVIVTYQEGSQAYNCYIDRLQVKAEKWKITREFFEGLLIVRLLTIPSG